MPLYMEYDIVQNSVTTSHGGTDPTGPIFNYSAAQIRLNLSDGRGYVDFEGIDRLRLIGLDPQLFQNSVTTSHAGTDPTGPIFNYSAAQIRLNLSDGRGYVDFEGIDRLRLIGLDPQLQKNPTRKSLVANSRPLRER